MEKFKIGIALGGGGARGFAHLGVLQALQERGIQPDIISGVSAGALVGAFIASGKSPQTTHQLMKENKITDYASINLPITGLLGLENLEKILKEHISIEKIEDLPTPFVITVTNILDGKAEYVREGNLIAFLQASASIPVLFSPQTIDGVQYVDGGLVDNFPIKPLEDCCTHLIGVSISPVHRIEKVENMVEIAARTFQLSVNNQVAKMEKSCTLFIEPKGLEKFGILDTTSADALFELGYEYTNKLEDEAFAQLLS